MTLQARLEALAGAVRDKINAVMPRLQPAGGTAGQALIKTTASDYNVSWAFHSFANLLNKPTTLAGYGITDGVASSSIGTAAAKNVGTSGAVVPLLSTANTWTLQQTFTGKIAGAASTTGQAPLNLPHGVDPTTGIQNGDIWTTSAGIFARINGVTVGPLGAAGTSGGGGTTVTQTLTATGTYTPTPGMKYARVQVVAPGAGGGSGRRGAAGSARSGGQGGAAGGYSEAWFSAAQIGASQPVTIGPPGTGGAAVTVDNTNGNPGTGGGNCSFGTLLMATGGPAGTAAAAVALTAGAIGGRGTFEGQRACQTSINSGLSGPPAIMGNGPGAGGSGGGISIADQAFSGAPGGRANAYTTSTLGFGGGAAAGANGTSIGIIGEGAGGGAASTTGAAAPGGVGGNYGAGGGGGGASANGFNSGAGGAGAPGAVIVEEFF